jgi:hypothetical protein
MIFTAIELENTISFLESKLAIKVINKNEK